MRNHKIIIFALILLIIPAVFAVNAFGQVTINPGGPIFYNVFLVGDLGIQGGGKGLRDFSVTFGGGPTGQQSITLVLGDLGKGPILTVTTEPEDYETKIQGTYNIGNIDNDFTIADYEILDTSPRLKDTVLATSRLPRSGYRLTVRLEPNGASDFIDFIVIPPYFQPIYPVNQQTSRAMLNFQYETNVGYETRISGQTLHIYEDPAGNREVRQGSKLPFEIEGSGTSESQRIIVDGSAIAPVLQDGKIYYWQIWGFVKTSHGDERVKGALSAFQYFEDAERFEYIGLPDTDKEAIRDVLIALLELILDKRAARNVRGYQVNMIMLDNRPATREEIMTILEAIIDGDVKVTSIRFQ